MAITNEQVSEHRFLEEMFGDTYFPDHLVERGKQILLRFCERIEAERPADLPALYALSAAATAEFNELQEDFWAAGSEIETAARDCIAVDFGFVATAYGFPNADLEELVADRDW
ncbi:DUF5713 family protein [Actinomadura atramentaria]|uniref:DUF5713 family protein n=1 Tax=Actinomadura atramentaria TaxID=1990 RepID=UPI0003A52717|nr:DUF5713 family protein [Actinomadura atramentaria]